MDSEIGRIGCTVYDELASELKPKGYIYSFSLEKHLHIVVDKMSYRETTNILNMLYHRDMCKSLKTSTIEDHIESAGKKIGKSIYSKSTSILGNTPGLSEDGLVENIDIIPGNIKAPLSSEEAAINKCDVFKEKIAYYNSDKALCDQITNTDLIEMIEYDPNDCVYISIDDVGVDHQKDRRKDGGSKNGKVVENTVIHIQSREGEYTITKVGMKQAFTILVGYLINNHLLENRHLYFFSDGAMNIKSNIELYFKPLCPYVLILDWYHLEKRMNELLSMALKGSKEDRHEIRHVLDMKLWAGNFDKAIEYISNIDAKFIKNINWLNEAIDYLRRKSPYAACYALRKLLGYRNSSNPAEKANDLIVANRQKHNGMSWSYTGSGALASISSLIRNNEIDSWIENHEIRFSPGPTIEEAA